MKKIIIIIAIIVLLIICAVVLVLNNNNSNTEFDDNTISNFDLYEDPEYENKSYGSNLSREQKIEILGLTFDDKNYAKIYEWGNTYICHVNDDCTQLIIDNQTTENEIHKLPNEIPIIFDTSEGYDTSNNKLHGNRKSFKQGYLLTDANVLYKGKFDFSNVSGDINNRSYVYEFQKISKEDEQPDEISVILYTVDRKTINTSFMDETNIYVKQQDGSIYIPYYTYLGEENILNSAVLVQKLYGVYQNGDNSYYFVCPGSLGGTEMIDANNNASTFYINQNSNVLNFDDSEYAYGLYIINEEATKIKVVKKDGNSIILNRIEVDNDFFEIHRLDKNLFTYERLQKVLNKEIY
jgi:hypothetical protein